MYVLKTGKIIEFQEKVTLKGTNIDVYKYKIQGDYLGEEDSNKKIVLIILVELNKYSQPAIKIQKIITSWKD